MATRASASKFDQHRILAATAERAASKVTGDTGVTSEVNGEVDKVDKANEGGSAFISIHLIT
jgi:hypothetical protein